VIGELQITAHKLPAMRAVKLSARLGRVIGPAMTRHHSAASATVDAAAAIRAGYGPRFLEMRCVRMGSHSTLTREERLAADVERFIESDPLLIYERRLRDDGVLDDERWKAVPAIGD